MEEFEKWWSERMTISDGLCYPYRSIALLAFSAGQSVEREACSRIAELTMCDDPINEIDEEWDNACIQISKAIRARQEATP